MSEKILNFGAEKEKCEKLAKIKQVEDFLANFLYDGMDFSQVEAGFNVWVNYTEDDLPQTKQEGTALLFKLLRDELPVDVNMAIEDDEDTGGLIRIII